MGSLAAQARLGSGWAQLWQGFTYQHAVSTVADCKREREREIHYVHSASLAYEDGIVFMSEPSAARQ